MNYVVTKQIAVEADSPEEAVAKLSEGKTISLAVNLRQQPPIPQQTAASTEALRKLQESRGTK